MRRGVFLVLLVSFAAGCGKVATVRGDETVFTPSPVFSGWFTAVMLLLSLCFFMIARFIRPRPGQTPSGDDVGAYYGYLLVSLVPLFFILLFALVGPGAREVVSPDFYECEGGRTPRHIEFADVERVDDVFEVYTRFEYLDFHMKDGTVQRVGKPDSEVTRPLVEALAQRDIPVQHVKDNGWEALCHFLPFAAIVPLCLVVIAAVYYFGRRTARRIASRVAASSSPGSKPTPGA
jgi:hypothetical protein